MPQIHVGAQSHQNFLDAFALLALNPHYFLLDSSAGAARMFEFAQQFRQVIANGRQSVERRCLDSWMRIVREANRKLFEA